MSDAEVVRFIVDVLTISCLTVTTRLLGKIFVGAAACNDSSCFFLLKVVRELMVSPAVPNHRLRRTDLLLRVSYPLSDSFVIESED